MEMNKTPQLLGTDREYELICRVEVQERNFYEIADKNFYDSRVVILLPKIETTECSRFFTTYLPDVGTLCYDCKKTDLQMDQIKCPHCGSERVHTEHTEVVGWVAYPSHSISRLALLRKNIYCSQHHLFVMGSGVENDLFDYNGGEVHVKIFAAQDDILADAAKSVDKTIQNKFANI